MTEVFDLIGGQYGLMGVIGLVIFLFVYKYSVDLFDLVERHTLGTRTYILEKLEMMFIEVKPEHITYMLLLSSFGSAILVITIFGIFSKWGIGVFLAVLFFIAGWKLPKPIINYMYSKRVRAYQGQMVDALTLLSNGLRAGLSLPQAIGMVVDEMPAPISQEFNVILQQNKIGVTLEQCFENLAIRVPVEDNDMFVSSINVLRETGGNLPEVFDTIVSVIRERVRLDQKIETATAQAMMQGYILFAMPFVIAIIFSITDPETMSVLFNHPLGIVIIGASLAFDLVGGFVIMKIVKIKV